MLLRAIDRLAVLGMDADGGVHAVKTGGLIDSCAGGIDVSADVDDVRDVATVGGQNGFEYFVCGRTFGGRRKNRTI